MKTLTLVQLNCFNCIFHHLKLELLTQFPASNEEKYLYLKIIYIFLIELFVQLSIYHKLYYPFLVTYYLARPKHMLETVFIRA